jgi:hypothetical protein
MNPMSYHQSFTKQPCQNLKQVRGFLRDHGTALAIAAYKLGGPTAKRNIYGFLTASAFSIRILPARMRLRNLYSHFSDQNSIANQQVSNTNNLPINSDDCGEHLSRDGSRGGQYATLSIPS